MVMNQVLKAATFAMMESPRWFAHTLASEPSVKRNLTGHVIGLAGSLRAAASSNDA